MVAAGVFVGASSLSAFLHITFLEVDAGTYFPEDPVEIVMWITDSREDGETACYEVHIHLTPDGNFRTENDHVLHVIAGGIQPGTTVMRNWVQMLPGNLSGTFFLDAEVTTCHGTTPAMSSPNSRLAPAFLVETAKITIQPSEYPETGLVSVNQAGTQGDGNADAPSMSANGRFVAFSSDATNYFGVTGEGEDVVGTIQNGFHDIFVKDRWSGQLERITTPLGAAEPDNNSFLPRISAWEGNANDGRWVVFHSAARNLVPGITNFQNDVFLRDRQTGSLERVSVSATGQQGNQASQNADVSRDGRYVVFESEATNLVPGDTNGFADIFLVDRQANAIRRVNVTNTGGQALGGHSRNPRISANGRHVVFESRATNLASGDRNNVWEVYVHDRDANHSGVFDEPGGTATRRISVAFDGSGEHIISDGDSRAPHLSYDGRYVVFHSNANGFYAVPAEGAIILTGQPARGSVTFNQNLPGQATIGFQPDQNATGSILLNSQPVNGHTVEISDGVNTRVFEFDGPLPTGVSPGHIRVVIGASVNATRNNLVTAINQAFTVNGEQSILAEATANGGPGVMLTNLTQGVDGNDQAIDNINAPTLTVNGMGTEEDNRAVITLPEPGDTLLVENSRTPLVTLEFFQEGGTDPTDHENRVIGLPIGRTAKETSLLALDVMHGLGYQEYDLPDLPDYLLPPFMDFPEFGDIFILRHRDREEIFTFRDFGPQLDPANIRSVLIGDTIAETRGNLVRSIIRLFDFDPLPAVKEGEDERLSFGNIYRDLPAQGAIRLRVNPEEGNSITLGDGFNTVEFRFEEEPDVDEDEFPPPFEIVNEQLIEVYIVEDEVRETEANLFLAIDFAEFFGFLQISAEFGFSDALENDAILLLNNLVGEQGNVPILIDPELTDEEIEEGEEPWAFVVGMSGGELGLPDDGERIVFHPENLLHPSVVFEYRQNLEETSPGAVGVPIGRTGAENEGNLLAAIRQTGLPWLTVEEGDHDLPNLVFNSLVGTGEGDIVFDFTASNPDSFASLQALPGTIGIPRDGAMLTISDGVNPPVTFEFTIDGQVENGNVPVAIMPLATVTRDHFIAAVNSQEPFNIEAVDASDEGQIVVNLFNTVGGEQGNVEIVATDTNGFLVVEGMSGGQDNPAAGEQFVLNDGINTPVTFEFVDSLPDNGLPSGAAPVLIGSDRAETVDAIIEVIKDFELRFEALAVTEGDHPAVHLIHLVPGEVGNEPIEILTPAPSFAVRGMEGGGRLTNIYSQVYLVDRDSNENGVFDEHGQVSLSLVSVSEVGTPADSDSIEPAISGDGKFVGFRTKANNLQPLTVTRSDGQVFANVADAMREHDRIVNFTDTDVFSDIYVRDLDTGINRRVSVNRFGEGLVANTIRANFPRSSRGVVFNSNGNYIAFETDDQSYNVDHRGGINDGNIIGGGMAHGLTNRQVLNSNGRRDIMIHDRRFATETPEEPPPPPVVRITSPVQGQGVRVDIPFELTLTASGVNGFITQVAFFENGELIGIDTTAPFRVTWIPLVTGQRTLTAVVTNSFGQQFSSSPVTVNVVPAGGVVGNPMVNSGDFVTQMFLDILGRPPSTTELSTYTSRLNNGTLSRPQLLRQILRNSDFNLERWVIGAYLTAVGLPPTREQLDNGVLLLIEGSDEDPPDDIPFIPQGPAGLPFVVSQAFASDQFFFRHLEPRGLNAFQQLGTEGLFDVVWHRNQGRSHPGFTAREGHLVQISFLPTFWTANQINLDALTKEVEVTALMLLVLGQEEIEEGAYRALLSQPDPSATVLRSQDLLNRFGEEANFFGLDSPEGVGLTKNGWMGSFNDLHFNYLNREGPIKHSEHGWLWAAGVGHPNGGIWFWDYAQKDWIWTRSDQYPFFYSNGKKRWFWYHQGGKPETRSFFDYGTGEWFEVRN